MRKKTMKTVAATMVLTMGLSVVATPAMAVSTNIVAETKNKNTLTVSQIQDLAVIYNNTAQKLSLSMKQLELGEQMARNQRRTVENQLNSMGSAGSMGGGAATIGAALQNLAASLVAQGKNPEEDAQYQALMLQYASAQATEQSMAAQMQSGFESALAGLETIDDQLDTMKNNKDDLNKSIKDLETQMRYSAASLSLSAVQLESSIALMEKQIALTDKALQIAELQQKLGMNIATDVAAQQASKREAQKNLEDMKENLSVLKRNINILIGRNAGNPLEITPMQLPGIISKAPSYSEQLVSKFTDLSYTLKTLERDKADLKDSVESDMGSDERQQIDYNVEAKNQEIKDQKQAIANNLKALLAKINSDAEAYQVSRQKYVNEQKLYEFAKKKYELGMISQLQLLQAELTLQSAELTNLQNGYAYYLDWQKYYAAEKGVDLSTLQ